MRKKVIGAADKEKVTQFWDKNPLFTGESNQIPGSKAFFEEHEAVIFSETLFGRLKGFIFNGINGKKVLDVGCGIGFWVRQFVRRNYDVYGCDITQKAVDLTKKSLGIFNMEADVIVGDAENLPYDKGMFDHINCLGVIHHTPDTAQCIKEFHRVLQPKGTLCFSVYYRNVLLSSRWLFRIVVFFASVIGIGLIGRGRENMFSNLKTPQELVRRIDGMDNPIGKYYSKKEVKDLVEDFFEIESIRIDGLPVRTIPVPIPKWMHQQLARWFGFMIFVRCCKKS